MIRTSPRTSPSARCAQFAIMRLYRLGRVLAPTSVPVKSSHFIWMVDQLPPASLMVTSILSSGLAASQEVGIHRYSLLAGSPFSVWTCPGFFAVVEGFTRGSYRLILESYAYGKNPEMAWSSDDDSKANSCSFALKRGTAITLKIDIRYY